MRFAQAHSAARRRCGSSAAMPWACAPRRACAPLTQACSAAITPDPGASASRSAAVEDKLALQRPAHAPRGWRRSPRALQLNGLAARRAAPGAEGSSHRLRTLAMARARTAHARRQGAARRGSTAPCRKGAAPGGRASWDCGGTTLERGCHAGQLGARARQEVGSQAHGFGLL